VDIGLTWESYLILWNKYISWISSQSGLGPSPHCTSRCIQVRKYHFQVCVVKSVIKRRTSLVLLKRISILYICTPIGHIRILIFAINVFAGRYIRRGISNFYAYMTLFLTYRVGNSLTLKIDHYVSLVLQPVIFKNLNLHSTINLTIYHI
jgi:hypothetical protein